jgi:DNA modification methylase
MIRVLQGDCREVLKTLEEASVHCVVTSPPYFGLRDYGIAGQLGLENSPEDFIAALVSVFDEVRRVLRDDGTVWLNLGDSYASNPASGGRSTSSAFHGTPSADSDHATPRRKYERPLGLKPKDLVGIPWRVALALQADGWWLRQDIIWHKPNPMPESVLDRCTKAHEYVFLLAKSERYHYDAKAIAEQAVTGFNGSSFTSDYDKATKPGLGDGERTETETRNKRSVWTVATQAFKEAHFATFPPDLIEPCILAGCPAGGLVLDPFGGAGTTGLVADRHHRDAILIELNPEYAEMARNRIYNDAPLFAEVQ